MNTQQKKEPDSFVSYAVKEGYLDEEKARKMSYKEKANYLDWCDSRADWLSEQEKEAQAEK